MYCKLRILIHMCVSWAALVHNDVAVGKILLVRALLSADARPDNVPVTEEATKLDDVERELRAMLAKMTGGLAPQDSARPSGTGGSTREVAREAGRAAANGAAPGDGPVALQRRGCPGQPDGPAENGDRRFAAPPGSRSLERLGPGIPQQHGAAQTSAHDVPGVEPKNAALVEFAAKQAARWLSPANSPLTNPEVLQQTVAERGQNLARGSRTSSMAWSALRGGDAPGTEDFRVGEKIAVTEGRSSPDELMELVLLRRPLPTCTRSRS